MKYSLFLIILFCSLCNAQIKRNWAYRDELIGYMESPKDIAHVCDRKKLEKIKEKRCTENSCIFKYKSQKGDSIQIKIECQKFNKSKHSILYSDTIFEFILNEKRIKELPHIKKIDKKTPYETDGELPRTEIKTITIKWGDSIISIPRNAYKNLFEVHLCLDYLPVEAYLSKDKKYLYLYISASDGAGSYSVKMIFNREKYISKIINQNECANGYDFIDTTGDCD